MKEFKGSLICSDTSKSIYFLICGLSFKNIFSGYVFLIKFIEIVVINSSDWESLFIINFLFCWFFNTFDNEFSQFRDKVLQISHDSILFISFDCIDHIFLSISISSIKIGDSTIENSVSKLDVFPYILFEQLSDEST